MKPIVIVGAGLAGLTCARQLQESGIPFKIFEAGDDVGGRVRTDDVDGFLLDRGFQVMLSAYPACQRWLDTAALDLRAFEPGAAIRIRQGWQRVVDPRRGIGDLWASLQADIGSFGDKLRVLKWALSSRHDPDSFGPTGTDKSSLVHLEAKGFSDDMINTFWRPWLSGIFLESDLQTSHLMLEFVFSMFARGETVVPRDGMQAIPRQLAAALPDESITLNQRVRRVEASGIELPDGSRIDATAVVLAVDGDAATTLGFGVPDLGWREARCLYFAAPRAPTPDGLLRLNGETDGVINHLVTLSQVNRNCAPEGQELVMVGIRPGTGGENQVIERQATAQLEVWFGPQVKRWRVLRHDVVKQALPTRGSLKALAGETTTGGLFQCGDYLRHPSIQGAMESGEFVAKQITDRFQRSV
ncbi:MAG: FAD-dependent oxidoreductase [Opitutaceae bacterium]|nr:FAD-dependent oxidoreductase [Opitutaceae bacterium]